MKRTQVTLGLMCLIISSELGASLSAVDDRKVLSAFSTSYLPDTASESEIYSAWERSYDPKKVSQTYLEDIDEAFSDYENAINEAEKRETIQDALEAFNTATDNYRSENISRLFNDNSILDIYKLMVPFLYGIAKRLKNDPLEDLSTLGTKQLNDLVEKSIHTIKRLYYIRPSCSIPDPATNLINCSAHSREDYDDEAVARNSSRKEKRIKRLLLHKQFKQKLSEKRKSAK